MKSLFLSKTFLLAVVQAVGGVIAAAVVADPALAALGWVAVAKSVVDVLLRLFTTEQVYVK